jgi:mannose-6-phosphate isomerase-like protein (cupin superfamily)
MRGTIARVIVNAALVATACCILSSCGNGSAPAVEPSVPSAVESPAPGVEEMLRAVVEDFRRDPVADVPVTFGVRVGEAEAPQWHVVVDGRKGGATESRISLHEGPPSEPAPFFKTDRQTLEKIYRGELASLTAMGKAKSSDFAPLDIDAIEGYQPTPEALDHLLRLSFHFWTRGMPEVIRFGDARYAREVHGGNAVLFYYQEGFRSGWFQVAPGQHVNADPSEQSNPFPTILAITRGTVSSRIGGEPRTLSEGEAVFIGPGVTHEFWNDGDAPGEGILLMFGEGA